MQEQKSKQFIPVKNLLRPSKNQSKNKQAESKVLNRSNLNHLSSFSKFDINGIIRLQQLQKKETQLMRTYISKQFSREYNTNRNKKSGIDMIIPSFQAFNISSDALFGLNLGQQQRDSRPKTQKKSSRQLKRKTSVKEYINLAAHEDQQKSTEKKRRSVYWKRQQKAFNNQPLFFKINQRSGDELNKQSYHQIHNRKWEKITERKFRSKNVENILRRKATHSFQDSMIQYCRRMKLDEQSRIFIFQSSDTWLKELLIEKGWVLNHDVDSKIFHLKWTYKTCNDKSNKNQLVNHFYQSDELTSKQGLAKMVRKSAFLQKNCPRSYDLGVELINFINDYNQTQILCGLKKIARLIESKKQAQQAILPQFLCRSFNLIKNKQIFEEPNSPSKIILHIPFAIHLCAFCQNLRCQLQDEIPLKENQLNENSIKNLLRLSLLDPPYDQIYKQYQQSSHGGKQSPKIVFNKDDINMYSSTISFQQASKELLELIYGYHCYFKDKKDTYRVEGERNIWIVKNRNSSKGVGINLSNDLQVLQKKVENRLAQKYIENCSLFKTPQAYFKYDLRVWVLVQSFCPLISYFYEQFYCRLCSAPYTLSNLSQTQSHLTNYTANKESYNWNNKHNSILTYNNFLQIFSEGNLNNIENLKRIVNMKLQKLIKQTLVPYTTVIQSHPQCFQLFGFDILVSQQLDFYLIEVNLSPACSDRNQWLSENVRRMGKGLLGIITQFWGPQKCEKEGWVFVK